MHDPDPPPPEPGPDAGGEPQMLAGRFRVERVLGRGGMGEVLLAEDTLLHRRVALKRVRADGGRGEAGPRAAVLKEARRASQVNDRRIAAIHDVLDLGDEVLIVMEYVDGETLRARLRSAMPIEEFWDLAGQCLEALGAAHAHGVIHRDIKPENLMVTRAHEIKILDFGIAWRTPQEGAQASETAVTETTELHRGPAGTPLYMAPEAHYGGRIDERTDIFSLGAVFYEMLTARHPFEADSQEHALERLMNAPLTPVVEVNSAVTSELSNVIDRMLARDPAERFASCADVRSALLVAKRSSGERLTSEETLMLGDTPRPGSRAAVRKGARVRNWAIAATAVAVVAVVVWRVLALPRLPAERRLAVLPPASPGADGDFAAYAVGATEFLASRLMRHQDRPGFQMATFGESYDEKIVTASDARKALGSNLALRSTLEQRADRLHGRLELLEPLHGRSLGSRTIDVSDAEPFAFADSLYHAALALLHLPMRPQTAQADLGIRGAGTLRFLMQGLGHRRSAATADDRQRAVTDLETACRTEPEPAVPRAWLASGLLTQYFAAPDSTTLARALATAREAVALDSTRAEAHRTLATALFYRKAFAEALGEYRKASLLDPTDDDGWRRWGRTWQRLGKTDEERKVYEAAAAKRPHCFKPRWWIASWDYSAGHFDAATREYEEMIQLAPEFWNGYLSLGALLLMNGEYTRAIDTLRLSLSLRPNSGAYSNLGTAYFNTGRLAQAVDAYNQAFQFGDATYVMWFNLGDAYYWLRNRPDQARDAYRQAIRLGREQMASRSQRGQSPDPDIPATLATALARLGERDSARVMLMQSLAIDSLSSDVQYHAALTEWQLGERIAAMDWLRRAVTGGYPLPWIRDSPVHRDWRADPGFLALVTSASPAGSGGSPGKAGTR